MLIGNLYVYFYAHSVSPLLVLGSLVSISGIVVCGHLCGARVFQKFWYGKNARDFNARRALGMEQTPAPGRYATAQGTVDIG